MAVMSLGVKNGAEVTVSVEGEDEETACAEIEEFLRLICKSCNMKGKGVNIWRNLPENQYLMELQ